MSEWIKCSERLPKINECVIVYSEDDHEFAYLINRETWIEWHSGNELDVTHWMPLPDPPKD